MEMVQVLETSMVVPAKATPRRRLWLSSLDIHIASRGHVSAIYLYDRRTDVDAIGRLKAALADALVPFYPLAGRFARNGDGRLEIDCNAEGALFLMARSNVLTADDVRRSPPDAELKRLFVPDVERHGSMLVVQVTFLKCEGVVIGAAMHHTAVDAPSCMHFMQIWSKIARGINLDDIAAAELPCHDRSLLCARSPPRSLDADDILSVISPKIPLSIEASRPIACKVFHISAGDIAVLKNLCSGGGDHGTKTTTFRAIVAHVWRCACAARGLSPGSRTHMYFLASVRRQARLPKRYFGSAVVMVKVLADVSDIVTGTLAAVSRTIGASIDRLNHDMTQSVVDYLEQMSGGGVVDESANEEGSLPITDFKVTSWLGMPATDADFGFGNPEFMRGVDVPSPGSIRLVSANAADGGGVYVSAYLEPSSLSVFEKLLSALPIS